MWKCGDVEMWKWIADFADLSGFRGSSSLKLINNISFFMQETINIQ